MAVALVLRLAILSSSAPCHRLSIGLFFPSFPCVLSNSSFDEPSDACLHAGRRHHFGIACWYGAFRPPQRSPRTFSEPRMSPWPSLVQCPSPFPLSVPRRPRIPLPGRSGSCSCSAASRDHSCHSCGFCSPRSRCSRNPRTSHAGDDSDSCFFAALQRKNRLLKEISHGSGPAYGRPSHSSADCHPTNAFRSERPARGICSFFSATFSRRHAPECRQGKTRCWRGNRRISGCWMRLRRRPTRSSCRMPLSDRRPGHQLKSSTIWSPCGFSRSATPKGGRRGASPLGGVSQFPFPVRKPFSKVCRPPSRRLLSAPPWYRVARRSR
mmetsp:Transcript_20579/g.57193  ORF Transcript_20579/g.57193 Transcript_20579/m.57193 type:complete len:324 (-) Transcript_20579:2278-3249(-)